MKCANPNCDKTAVLYHGQDQYCTFCWIRLLPPPTMCVNCAHAGHVQVIHAETGKPLENVVWADTELGAYLVLKCPEEPFFDQLDVELVRAPIRLQWADEVRLLAQQLLDESRMENDHTITVIEHQPEGTFRLTIPLERFEREDIIDLGLKGLLFTIATEIEAIEEEV